MRLVRKVVSGVALLGAIIVPLRVEAQRTPARLKLDEWVVLHYKGVQLLPDSAMGVITLAGSTTTIGSNAPRVEALRSSAHRDTLVALQFSDEKGHAIYAAGTTVYLADRSGAVTSMTGRITARRAFRAPRLPNASPLGKVNTSDMAGAWRTGWAYLVAVSPEVAAASSEAFSGWLLLGGPARKH